MRLVLLIAAAVSLALAAPVLARPAYVSSTVNLRAAPGTDKAIVTKIPAGSLVDAGDCTAGWCAVSWQDKSGYAIESAVDLSGRVPTRVARPRAYGEEPPIYYEAAPPPVFYGPYYRYRHYGPYWGPRYRW